MKTILKLVMAIHIALYRLTGGKVGGKMGSTILLLDSVGRKSGQRLTAPVVYFEDNGNYVVAASYGGAPNHPGWYFNLMAQPFTTIQVMGNLFQVTVTEAQGEERERLWAKLVAGNPQFAGYKQKTERVIPLLILSPK